MPTMQVFGTLFGGVFTASMGKFFGTSTTVTGGGALFGGVGQVAPLLLWGGQATYLRVRFFQHLTHPSLPEIPYAGSRGPSRCVLRRR